jgi:hypothetical protein
MQNGKELWISQIYFPMEHLMDQVHGAWTGRRGSGPPWTEVAQTKGHGYALAARRHYGLPVLTGVVEGDEPDEAVPEGCSPEQERR